MWVYNTTATVHHGVEAGVGAKLIFTAEISLDGTELFDVCAIGPSPLGATADNLPFAANNIFRDSFVAPGADAHCRAMVARCESCAKPHARQR